MMNMENAKCPKAWIGVPLANIERMLIRATLEVSPNRSQAAIMLGISERSLYRKIKQLMI